jgi:hypothetical protein
LPELHPCNSQQAADGEADTDRHKQGKKADTGQAGHCYNFRWKQGWKVAMEEKRKDRLILQALSKKVAVLVRFHCYEVRGVDPFSPTFLKL